MTVAGQQLIARARPIDVGRSLGPKANRWGMMRLTTIGRRSGQERSVILGYFEEGQNLVTMAMNGWADPEPAWWLNLQADPHAIVDLAQDRRKVMGRAARERNGCGSGPGGVR